MEQAAGRETPGPVTNRRGPATPTQMITFGTPKTLNPKGKALAVEAWMKADKGDGVIVARGGPRDGFALTIEKGRPRFHVRANEKLSSIGSRERILGKWHHLAGVLAKDKTMRLYLDGRLVAKGEAPGLLGSDPVQSLDVGADNLTAVGNYSSPFNFTGLIDEVRLHLGEVDPASFAKVVENAGQKRVIESTCVLACSFDDGKAVDLTNGKHKATVTGAKPEEGKLGGAFRFTSKPKKGGANKQGGSGVAHNWTHDVPVLARGMVLAKDVVFVAGPPDVMDEEETFGRIMARDKSVDQVIAKQEAALAGNQGSILLAVSTETGETLAKYDLGYLPTWDGLAAANGKLFFSTEKGTITCLQGKK